MSNKVLLYPTLNEDIMEKICLRNKDFSFFYNDADGERYELNHEPAEAFSTINILKDERGVWNAEEYNLCFERRYFIKNLKAFFGENGLACSDATLGFAVVWKSADSKQRGSIPISQFGSDEMSMEMTAKGCFNKAQIRGRIDIATVLYIAKEGVPKQNERHLANTQGYILGEFEEYTLMLDGNASSFPVFEVTEHDQPLWYVKCDWEDPTIDKLEDCVSINLNKANSAYKYIDRNQKTFNSQLLAEIMASAVSLIIEKIRWEGTYWDEILKNDGLEDGSVGQAIYYFSETHGWDISTPESTSICARKFFEQGMREL